MYENINKLLQVEKNIINSYNYLLELEKGKLKDTILFKFSVEDLQKKVTEEEELFNKLTDRELSYLSNNDNLLIYNNSEYNIKGRINKKIATILASKTLKESTDRIIIDAINSEAIDIYLSFIDEEIDDTNDEDKEILIEEKYKYIYNLFSNDETRLIKRNFHTDKSLYLYSKMYADANKIDNTKYNMYKDAISLSILHNASQKISSNNNKYRNNPYPLIILSEIRTYFLLIDQNSYNMIMEDIIYNDSYFIDSNYSFADRFSYIIEKDKERHKVLSLVPNKPHE